MTRPSGGASRRVEIDSAASFSGDAPRTVADRIRGSRGSRRRRGRGVEGTHRRGGEEREDAGDGGAAVEAAGERAEGGEGGRGRGASAEVGREKAITSTSRVFVIPIVAAPGTHSELAAARTVASRRATGLAATLAATGVPAMKADMVVRAAVRRGEGRCVAECATRSARDVFAGSRRASSAGQRTPRRRKSAPRRTGARFRQQSTSSTRTRGVRRVITSLTTIFCLRV